MFGFTKQEKTVILFLIISFTAGTGIISYKKYSFSKKAEVFREGYAEQDEKFLNASKEDSFTGAKEEKTFIDNIKIDINSADGKELMRLPGIGPALSERIINYRNNYGNFKNSRDIVKVKGIGEKKYKKMSSLICIE